ncbi:MAG: spike base protein, RCAP_Rcc01079 family [Beijerinckiaceae bacterium]
MAQIDIYQNDEKLMFPYIGGFPITPDDISELPKVTRGIYVGSDNVDVSVEMLDGSVVTYKGVRIGTDLPVRAVRVKATGTTATDLIGQY